MKYFIDTHTHSVASGHAYNTIREMAAAAAERGIRYLGITEHAPKMPGTCHELYFSNLGVVEREQYGVRLLMGAELNIMDYSGGIDLPEYILKKLDIVTASLHVPCIKSGSVEENTAAVIGAIRNPMVHIIGHPDDARYPVDYEAVVKAAKDYHTLLELNNNSLSPDGPRKGTWDNDVIMLDLCRQMKVPVVIGSDAHTAEQIGVFDNAEALLRHMDFPEELIVNRDYTELCKFIGRPAEIS